MIQTKNKRARKGRKRKNTRKFGMDRNQGNIITRDNPRFPNDIKQIPIHNRAIRYIVVTAGTYNITPAILLSQLLATVNASVTAIKLLGSIRLRRISLYFVPSTGDFGASTSVLSFTWSAGLNSPENVITDRGTATQPACIKVRPIFESLAGMWFDNNSPNVSEILFTFTSPANTVLDIDFDFTLGNGATGTFTLNSAATFSGVIIPHLNAVNIVPDGGVATGRS
jgi:hypothetical protein